MTINTQKLRDYTHGIDAKAPDVNSITTTLFSCAEAIDAQAAEIARLREALEWCADMAKRMGNAALQQNKDSMLALMQALAVDHGSSARAALQEERK